MNIYKIIKEEIIKTFSIKEEFAVETPKNKSHGDIAINLALVLSKILNKNPIDTAKELLPKIKDFIFVEKAEIAGAGFINLTLTESFLHNAFKATIEENYGMEDIGLGEPINIEYCSANPTGPIHIGHTRGTIYGDVLSTLLSKNGYKVTREFYINDAGGQINTLLNSVSIRIRQIHGEKVEIPSNCYPGEYLIDIAKEVLKKFGESVTTEATDVQKFVISRIMERNIQDLTKLKIQYDVFTSERQLIENGEVEKAFKILERKSLLYKGSLPKPKGKSLEEWEEREQLLFKSMEFGDSEDRALKKSDGTYTYFTSDIAYHKNKMDRGFYRMVLVLGADHVGYISRITAAAKAVSSFPERVNIIVKVCQIVKFLEDGKPVSMSKRKGTFTTLSEVLEEVEPDILRFIMLTKKNDSQLDFDLIKVKEESKENPIFYIQYTYSRCSSLLRNFKGIIKEEDILLLKTPPEMEIVKKALLYPKIIEMSIKRMEPHLIANYLSELASLFHTFWNMGNENHNFRFLTENEKLSSARMFLVKAVMNIISSAFSIFNIKPIQRM